LRTLADPSSGQRLAAQCLSLRYLRNGYVGLAIQLACILLTVWARLHLGESWSSKVLVAPGQQLIDTGPYRKVRHPIYTGILGMFVGTAIVTGELHGLIAIVIMAVAYWRKIRVEERLLVSELRDTYEGYRRRTWALIPFLI
jgi:protein-S-isoprenylcysteine O-methyltransferase Ste14